MVGTPSATDTHGAAAAQAAAHAAESYSAAITRLQAKLREVDHQTKNNLQLIASLLLLQSRKAPDAETRAALGSALERVNAVAAVHRRLFDGEAETGLDLPAFVAELAEDTRGALERDDIQISLAADPARVSPASAAPLALIINELILNAVAHAFPPGRGGQISIMIQNHGDRLRIEVADNGVGMPPGAPRSQGIGLQIVDLLSQQLRAEIERSEPQAAGVRTTLVLPAGQAL